MKEINMINQSRQLSKFYKELSEWIARGCIDEESVFSIADGLCDNLYNWAYEHAKLHSINSIDRQDLQAELRYQLKVEFGYTNYPFNEGQPKLYADENNKYTNQARLDWIAEHTPSED